MRRTGDEAGETGHCRSEVTGQARGDGHSAEQAEGLAL